MNNIHLSSHSPTRLLILGINYNVITKFFTEKSKKKI